MNQHNLIGQKVRTLVHELQTAGLHNISFDVSGLAIGIYLYGIRAGNFTQRKNGSGEMVKFPDKIANT